ncbi:helix-turn-helix domain-containing protein [Asticcacaulis taihuensis]|uniref:DNA-binding transcriptional regulator, XRE-family HTH domain n=1 Tax=Asticcacaulis taihuensis TaxID=260084 RepID=A0A1G4SWG6_9CAUL|nr:helix-turn-helix transcriptional regulator [Asticcacaulis taihuensis]SCW73287.1 DNA-binding transcriptional regulator, XRE-family HTH domain [Asticcacaulis taihuensis]
MPKTVFTGHHKTLIDLLIETRKKAGLTQTELGQRLGKTQKFISLVESSQRRIDVLEFYAIARAIGVTPEALFQELSARLPQKIDI